MNMHTESNFKGTVNINWTKYANIILRWNVLPYVQDTDWQRGLAKTRCNPWQFWQKTSLRWQNAWTTEQKGNVLKFVCIVRQEVRLTVSRILTAHNVAQSSDESKVVWDVALSKVCTRKVFWNQFRDYIEQAKLDNLNPLQILRWGWFRVS